MKHWLSSVLSLICPKEHKNVTSQKVIVERKPKRVRFRSFYMLGEGFLTFHKDVNPKNFIVWLQKNHFNWYKSNNDLAKGLVFSELDQLVEAIYGNLQNHNCDDNLAIYFRRWYVQEHGLFSFSAGDRVFVPLFHGGHMLQVLYNVPDEEIVYITSIDEIKNKLISPDDFRNNWFVGTNSSNALEAAVAAHLITNADKHTAHYKLICDDNSTNHYYIELLKDSGIINYVEIPFQTVTTIPNDATTIKRFNRYEQFNDFASSAEETFRQFLSKTPKAKRFDEFYMLNIWNDKKHPKNNATYVNVSFGSRPLTVSHHNKGFSSTVEEGARLCFYRIETGEVSVSLYPAKTENRKPKEDAIVMEELIEPLILANHKMLKKYWNYLISYMECTSIDGNPSFKQKIKIKIIRFSHNTIVDKVYMPTKKSVFLGRVLEFVFSIGLSGCVLAVLQFAYNKLNPDMTVTNNKDEIVSHIDSLQNVLRQSTDTISAKLNLIQGNGHIGVTQQE